MTRLVFVLILMVLFSSVSLVDLARARQTKNSPDDLLMFELINYDPSPAQPGREFEVNFKVKNIGAAVIEELRIDVSEKYPFTKVAGEEYYFKTLELGEEKEFSFTLKTSAAVSDGVKSLTIVYSYTAYPRIISESFDVRVASPSKVVVIDEVSTQPEKIRPGSIGQVILKIANPADYTMSNIYVKINFTSPIIPAYSTNEKIIREIKPNEAVDVVFDVVVEADAELKPYLFPLDISYYDDTGTKYTRTDKIGVMVDYEPEYQITIDESEVLKRGQAGKVTIKISNKGPSELKFVTLELISTKDYDIIGENKKYVGNIESDDYESEDFRIHAKKCWYLFFCKKTIPIKMIINYKDSYNQERSKVEEVPLRVYSALELSKYGLAEESRFKTLIVYLILIIFVYTAFREWKKEKNIATALKSTVKIFVVAIVRFLRKLRWHNLKKLPRKIRIFLIKTR